MSLALRFAARSDRGLIRGNNQDSVYAGPRLLAHADGMGGHAAGDVASKVVIAALEHLDDDTPSGDMLQALRGAIFEGSEHLREVIRDAPQLEGMGTTLTAILFAGGRLALAHVGDSRAYLLRDGQLSQITHDDTFVQTLIDDGRITPEEANSHPQRSLLLRALNGQDVEPDLSMREARAGDRYLLCSDGLSGVVSEETLADALKDPDPQSTADRLIELALRSGGPDNITVIVADVVEDGGGTTSIDPVVDGAAGDNVGQRQVDSRSAAGRAALADPQPAPPPATTTAQYGPPPKRRRPLRIALVAVGLVLILAAAGAGFYVWAMGHWFVGVNGAGSAQRVSVYRGLNASFAGLDFYQLDQTTDLPVRDLNPAARSRVTQGITASSSSDAHRILTALRAQRLPVCPEAGAGTSSSAGSSTAGAPSGSSATTSAGTPSAGPSATPSATPPASGASPVPGQSTDTLAAPTTSASSTGEPGVDCREQK
jgi:serine/threonine protein phosphatase PrpC